MIHEDPTPLVTTAMLVIAAVVAKAVADAVGAVDVEEANTLCSGLFGCGATTPVWWLTAAGVLLVPPLGVAVYYWRTHQ